MKDSLIEFVDFVRGIEPRFYQERDLGLDLYHTGFPGVLLAFVMAASLVVFLLTIFHTIPQKRHVVRLLLGLGAAALLLGLLTSYVHFLKLPALESVLIRGTAGPAPVTDGQRSAVISLPLVLGSLTLIANTLGCLYMAIFWSKTLLEHRRSG